MSRAYSFFYWWLGATVIYLLLTFSTPSLNGSFSALALVGLFVPYGFWNFFGTISAFMGGQITVLIPAMLLGVCIVFGDFVAQKINFATGWRKIFFNLCLLFLLTFFTDFLLYGKWASLDLVLGVQPF